ncbi:MAG: protoporphyrinogen oxidase [Candidatus Nanopelagicales bacterium]
MTSLPDRTVDVVVVGGGASGLATAYWLRTEHDADVVVLEASDRAGGKVTTRELGGLPVDTGPDAFLSRAADLGELVSRLGLVESVVGPLPGGAFVWSRGALHPIPQGGFVGIPDRVLPLVRSRLLSPLGVARAGLDLVLPRTPLGDDPSVADVVRPRLGHEAFDRLVQPLLGGVHAGSAERLSARSTVPEVLSIARSGRSLVLSLRSRRKAAPKPSTPPAPPLVSISGGMSRLTDALVAAVGAERVLVSTPATSLRRTAVGWDVVTPSGTIAARTVVLASPAYTTADLVADTVPALADELRGIEYADVANVTLALRRSEVGELVGTGFLVPPVEDDIVVGCTWLTSKWPHLAGTDTVLVRCMVGRDGDSRWTAMDDDALVAAVRASLARMMRLTAEPVDVLVQRWPGAMPQYVVGHAARLARIDAHLVEGLHLTGAAYRGSGLAGCVGDARRTATAVAASLTTDLPSDPSLQGAAR